MVKQSCQDALLFFRLGDFYELFLDDALLASERLGLTLTGRGTGDNRVPMCGVPFHAAESYIARLVKDGYRVAICEQMEDPKTTKGLVKRDIIRIVTPGTGFDFIKESDVRLLVACVGEDVTTDEVTCAAVMDPMTGDVWKKVGSLQDLLPWLSSLHIEEMIASHQASSTIMTWSKEAAKQLHAVFSPFQDDQDGQENSSLSLRPEDVLVRYVRYTGKRDLVHLKDPQYVEGSMYLQLSQAAITSLELLQPISTIRRGTTLFETLDLTQCAMGKRKLREMIERPFIDIAAICLRQDAVAYFMKHHVTMQEIAAHLKGFPDLSRLVSRISYGTATPRDLVQLASGLKKAHQIKMILNEAGAVGELLTVMDELHDLMEIAQSIQSKLIDDPTGSGKEGGILRPFVDETVDHLREVAQGGRNYLAILEQRERQRTGIKSLKVSYNKVFGYYIEVTSANASSVPEDYERKQTLVGAERFVTPELRQYEQEITQADERIKELEWEHFVALVQEIKTYVRSIQEISDALGNLDAIMSLAFCAVRYGYTRPEIDQSGDLVIEEGRHPVVERHVDGNYVPNDTLFTERMRRMGIVTGPNMAGKSTYMRQVALIVILAQMGSFVPAKFARIGIVDKVFTRVGASDDVSAGLSTFMVEMTESAEILRDATPRSLLLLDEIGRGTATYDGMSIAQAMIEYLHDHIHARTLFATHYHELTVLATRLENVFNLSVSVSERDDQIVFLHRIVERPADRSYGIQVALHAGVPRSVTERAKVILAELESNVSLREITFEQMAATFEESNYTAILEEIIACPLDDLTPKEALSRLYVWQEQLRQTRG